MYSAGCCCNHGPGVGSSADVAGKSRVKARHIPLAYRLLRASEYCPLHLSGVGCFLLLVHCPNTRNRLYSHEFMLGEANVITNSATKSNSNTVVPREGGKLGPLKKDRTLYGCFGSVAGMFLARWLYRYRLVSLNPVLVFPRGSVNGHPSKSPASPKQPRNVGSRLRRVSTCAS